MSRLLITNAKLVFPGERMAQGSVLLDAGRIAAIDPAIVPAACQTLDGRGRLLTPGLIDCHTHGIETFAYDNGPEDLLAGVARLPRYGTTTVLPTVVPQRAPAAMAKLARIAEAIPKVTGAMVPGLHLEGPFLALAGAACETLPGDTGLLNELIAACMRRVRVMSVSPETPNILPVIERLKELEIVPFLTHTRATAEQTAAAIAAGARHATHFYDVFPVPAEIEPGVRPAGAVEAVLADPRVSVDFIADGCHVDPVVIRMALQAKGWPGVVLITDSNIGAGLPPGEYPTPWGYPVRVAPGCGARIADRNHKHFGALAGSVLTMNVGIANLLQWLGAAPEKVWAMGSANPARLLALAGKGRLAPGADADLTLWNEDLTPARTWVRGQQAYSSDETNGDCAAP